MNQLRKLLKQASISPEQLAEGMEMTFRSISYHYTTGRMPYAVIYKMHKVTGIPITEIVPTFLAEQWLFLYEEQLKLNKPRGKVKKLWSKNLELDEPVAGQSPREKLHVEPIASPVAPIPKTIVPPTVKPKGKSIADLMKSQPATDTPSGEPEPDFSNIPDEVFATSMDQIPKKGKR